AVPGTRRLRNSRGGCLAAALMIRLRLKPEQLTEKEFNKISIAGLHAVSTKTERDWPDLCFKIVSGRLGHLDPWTSSYMVNSLRPRNLVPGAFLLLLCIGGYEPAAGACSDAHQCLDCPHCSDCPLCRHSPLAISPR